MRTGEDHPTPRRIALPGVPPTADNTFLGRHEGHRESSEEKRDAREPLHYLKRRRGTSYVWSRGTRPPSAPPQRPPPWMGGPTPGWITLPGVPRNVRPEGHSHGWAAPLPEAIHSLGYPATNSPRGKAQAGDPLLRLQGKPGGWYRSVRCRTKYFPTVTLRLPSETADRPFRT